MYPERDSRADAFDDALERRRTGDNSPLDDQELQELVDLATRLEQELPTDLPDPAFRTNLREQLLQGAGEPGELPGSDSEPLNLDEERWHRRLVASPWRASTVAAACMLFVVIAFVLVTNPFGGSSGEGTEEVTSFRPVDADDRDGVDDTIFSNQFLLNDDGTPMADQWITASFPPIDVDHVVLPPLLVGFLPFADRQKPPVAVSGVTELADNVDMPSTDTVYYLNAPPDGATMLSTLRSTLGISGELIEGNGDGEPFRIVDDENNDILLWDPASAFFHFQGDLLDEPVDGLLDSGATPAETARRFLELIGFDLYTIQYQEHAVENGSTTEVQFRPQYLPTTALEIDLGGSVVVDADGAILEARLHWLSLVAYEEVALREPEEIIADVEHDAGYTPPAPDDVDEMMIDADDMVVVHVLTRLDESNFVLQPAVKLIGNYENDVASMLPGPARYFVPAVDNDN